MGTIEQAEQQWLRPMWVWNTRDVLSSTDESKKLLSAAKLASITDLYLYLDATQFTSQHDALRGFVAQAYVVEIRVWALEGGRVYFSDAEGPFHFYKAIENLIAFNAAGPDQEQIYGFSADLEAYCPGGRGAFHNGIKDSSLDTREGTGVWMSSQAEDRNAIVLEWLVIHQTAKSMLNAANMRLAAAFPHWTSDYCGEPLRVRYPNRNSQPRSVLECMLDCVDDYVVMSYHTEPSKASARVIAEASLASSLQRPTGAFQIRVLAALEVNTGVGSTISHGDTLGKQSRQAVLQDVDAIMSSLQVYPAFRGVAVHAWSGWNALPA